MLDKHVAASYLKYSETVEISVQVEKELRTHVTSIAEELKVNINCIERYEKDRMKEHTRDREAFIARQKELDVSKNQLRNKEGTTRQM